MDILDSNGVEEVVLSFLSEKKNAALYAGAGVGVRAGLPDWMALMEHLAEVAGRFHQLTSDLILDRARNGHFTGAATIYKTSKEIPEGVMFSEIAKKFKDIPRPEKLNALLSLPFSAVFTSNYDKSLHHAFAKVVGEAPDVVELDDPTMKTANFKTDFYIARIHGRAEVPESMVLDDQDYKDLLANRAYMDFVTHILTRYSCLFLGFSFVDPAISFVLEAIEQRLKPNYPESHLALLPNTGDSALASELTKFNINVLFYDLAGNHEALWQGVTQASRKFSPAQKKVKPKANQYISTIHRYLARTYAQTKVSDEIAPLRDFVIDAIIMDSIVSENHNEEGVEDSTIISKVSKLLRLPAEDVKEGTKKRLDSLVNQGQLIPSGKYYSAREDIDNSAQAETDIEILHEGILNRIIIRNNIPITENLRRISKEILWEILMIHGWDLSAVYMGADHMDYLDLVPTINQLVEKHVRLLGGQEQQSLKSSLYSLLQNPDGPESGVLAQYGRLSFGIQLVMNVPSHALGQEDLMPEKVYLDSNFLLRALIQGHPLNPIFSLALKRLISVRRMTNSPAQLLVLEEFLEEAISHRNAALREVDELKLENFKNLQRHILYYGAHSVNVFIQAYSSMAYASLVSEDKKQLSFRQFLDKFAPFNNVNELKEYLKVSNIRSVNAKPSTSNSMRAQQFFDELRVSYLEQSGFHGPEKPEILVRNESLQLFLLNEDLQKQERVIFVTGDQKLIKSAVGPFLGRPGSALVSNRAFVQMIDMFYGLRGSTESLARLLWSHGTNDEDMLIINYYTNLAMQFYGEALTFKVSDVLVDLLPEIKREAERQGITLAPQMDTEIKREQGKLLDRFEDKFYRYMRDEKEKMEDEN